MTRDAQASRTLTGRAQALLLVVAVTGLLFTVPLVGVPGAGAIAYAAFRYHARPLLIATTAAIVLYTLVIVSAYAP